MNLIQLEVRNLSDAQVKRNWCSDEDFIAAWQNTEFESAQAVADHLGLKVASVQARARAMNKAFADAGVKVTLREFPKRTVTAKDNAYWAAMAQLVSASNDESSDEN